MPLEDFLGHATAYEVRGFFRRVAADSGALRYIELAVLFRRCSRGFSHTAAAGFAVLWRWEPRIFYQVYCVEEKRGLDQSVIINIIRANWASARELIRPSWDSRVGLTLLKCVYFFLYCSRSEAYAGFVFIENHTIIEVRCRPGIPADYEFFVNPAETGYSRLNFGLTLR